MAWRPNENLIDGELSNRVPGKVTGWMRFFRRRRQPLRVVFDLAGDFHEDIRGSDIVLKNDPPTDRNISLEREGTYMEGFDPVQRGTVGDMTAGLPLGPWTEALAKQLKTQLEIIWQENGITGSELEERRRCCLRGLRREDRCGRTLLSVRRLPLYRVVFRQRPGRAGARSRPDHGYPTGNPPTEKSPQELAQDRKKRAQSIRRLHARHGARASEKGKNGNVTGIVIG